MTRAIREYAQETGMSVGFKPRGESAPPNNPRMARANERRTRPPLDEARPVPLRRRSLLTTSNATRTPRHGTLLGRLPPPHRRRLQSTEEFRTGCPTQAFFA